MPILKYLRRIYCSGKKIVLATPDQVKLQVWTRYRRAQISATPSARLWLVHTCARAETAPGRGEGVPAELLRRALNSWTWTRAEIHTGSSRTFEVWRLRMVRSQECRDHLFSCCHCCCVFHALTSQTDQKYKIRVRVSGCGQTELCVFLL